MHANGRVKAEPLRQFFDEVLNRTAGQRAPCESVVTASARCAWRPEHRTILVIAAGSDVQPRLQALKRFWMKRCAALLAALPMNLQNLVAATRLVVANANLYEFANTAGGVRQDSKNGAVANADWRLPVGRIEQAPAFFRCQAHRFPVARHRG